MEINKRILPVINVAGADFYVDAVDLTLTDTKNKDNIINVLDMLMVEDHLEMLFDKQTRNVKSNGWSVRDEERYEYVWLRPLEVYDIEGAQIRLGHEGVLIPKNLPVVEVEGTKFLWDEQHTRLIQKENPYNQIRKNDVEFKEGIMGFYFDTQRKVVPFPQELELLKSRGQLPSHLSFIPTSEINQKIDQAKNKTNRVSPKSNSPKLR